MPSDLTNQAISQALNSNWQEAKKLNLQILKENKDNIESLNRLAHAYKELGEIVLAQKTYRKVLSFDKSNQIASKNLKILSILPKKARNGRETAKNASVDQNRSFQTENFVEEPGKTRVVNLVNLAPSSIILLLSCGRLINLAIRRRTVIAVTRDNIYLGALPDDLSCRLIKFIAGGNRYEVFVKTVSSKNLSVFIREVFRCQKFKGQSSFPVSFFKENSGKKDNYFFSSQEVDGVLPNEGFSAEEEEKSFFQ